MLFRKIDDNYDGYIDISEFKVLMKMILENMPIEEKEEKATI